MNPRTPPEEKGVVTPKEALRVWTRVGLQSFGGPAGQIAVMHRILVDEKKWVGERRFLHALNYCMLLPGPEAQQLATYLGWLLHGFRGGLVAGGLFILPGFIAILVLSYIYAQFQGIAFLGGLFMGLKAAVLAVVVQAVVRIGRRVLRNPVMLCIAISAFVAIFIFTVPFPAIVVGAIAVGMIGGTIHPPSFDVIKGKGVEGTARLDADGLDADGIESEGLIDAQLLSKTQLPHTKPSTRKAAMVAATFLALWLVPVFALVATLGVGHTFAAEGIFFSKAAVVTFGGAYAVLAYIAQQGVERFGWLQTGEMLDGLGMAETTPGPLIMVVQFVGFMGAYRNPGELNPMVAGTVGALITTWVTFVPCFLWIFLGAPYVEALRGNPRISAALSAVTAAVVGVVLNLSVWFGLHVVFAEVATLNGPVGIRLLVPNVETISIGPLAITAAALVALLRFRMGMFVVLGGSVAAGVALTMLA